MSLNLIGLITALTTFLGIWLGHVAVRKVEFISPRLWLPALIAATFGLGLEILALLSPGCPLSAAAGILGMTLLWDALEFYRQQRRVEKGYAPANPHNPRHARILRHSPHATPVDWLERQPLGRPLTAEEKRALQEAAR